MDLHTRLKIETKIVHAALERNYFFKKILNHQITLIEYQCLIEKLYGFITPCERLLEQQPQCAAILPRYRKGPWLQCDLLSLGILITELEKIICCAHIPRLIDLGHVLGYLYVIERIILSGQIITSSIQNYLPVTPEYGLCFFYAYGNSTRRRWDQFCQIINSHSHDTVLMHNIISGAMATYILLDAWLEQAVTARI